MKIAIIVLAAGASSRMKTPKQLIKIGNNFLLETVLKKAKSINRNHVYCVLGANSDLIRREISCANIHFIYNENYKNGISSSIAFAMKHLHKKLQNYEGVLVLLGDQPAIDKLYLQALIESFLEKKSKIIASNYNDIVGVPAIFPKNYFLKLQMIHGDKGAKEILQNNKDVLVIDKTTNLIDIDTIDDLQKFKQSILES